jgi:DNA primase
MRYIADRVGIELQDFQRTQADDERDRLLAILNLAKEYYHYLLTKHKVGQSARDYLQKRGITQESIKLFQIGYAMQSWDGLINFLHKKKKYSLQDIEKTGLIIGNKTGRYYDRFRDRIIFPLKNHRGQVVGFSGRLLSANPKEAKYINSPETTLYHKSELLFGYSELFREIKKKNEIIVTEGEFDVISSAQAHVNNIVAIKGSAMSHEQVKLFARVADKVLLALDADEAGIKATRRAIELIKDTTLELRVINLLEFGSNLDGEAQNQSKDPDELARKNPKEWREMAGKSISVYEFLLNIILAKYDASKPEDKGKILVDLAPILTSISLEVERDFYIQKLAVALNVKPDLILEDIQKINAKLAISPKNNVHVETKADSSLPSKKNTPKSIRNKHEEYLLFLLLRAKNQDFPKFLAQIKDMDFITPSANNIISKLLEYKKDFSLKEFAQTLSEDYKQAIFDWYINPEYISVFNEDEIDQEWSNTLKSLKNEIIKDEINNLNKKIEQLDSKNQKTVDEEKELGQLLLKIVELQKRNKEA